MTEDAAARRFRDACNILRELHRAGFTYYVASDVLHLMRGPSHDFAWKPLRSNIVASANSLGISGGDW